MKFQCPSISRPGQVKNGFHLADDAAPLAIESAEAARLIAE